MTLIDLFFGEGILVLAENVLLVQNLPCKGATRVFLCTILPFSIPFIIRYAFCLSVASFLVRKACMIHRTKIVRLQVLLSAACLRFGDDTNHTRLSTYLRCKPRQKPICKPSNITDTRGMGSRRRSNGVKTSVPSRPCDLSALHVS